MFTCGESCSDGNLIICTQSDLPGMLGVDFIHCEHESEEIIAQSKGAVGLVQGDMITTQYFDSVGVEINEMLKESGMVRIGEMGCLSTIMTFLRTFSRSLILVFGLEMFGLLEWHLAALPDTCTAWQSSLWIALCSKLSWRSTLLWQEVLVYLLCGTAEQHTCSHPEFWLVYG